MGLKDIIGSIVQAHTYLTEIKLAVDLFWRVKIPPEKIIMGFGCYRRSFTLAYKFCTNPGYLSKGALSAGPYSDTGGILVYYEIMAVLNGAGLYSKQLITITPVYDRAAAVKYFTFNKD